MLAEKGDKNSRRRALGLQEQVCVFLAPFSNSGGEAESTASMLAFVRFQRE